MEEIKIEAGVELPETGWKGSPLPNYPKSSIYPWSRMKVGDSFFVPVPDGGDVVRLMNRITGSGAHRVGAGCTKARCRFENGRLGVRVWKVSENND